MRSLKTGDEHLYNTIHLSSSLMGISPVFPLLTFPGPGAHVAFHIAFSITAASSPLIGDSSSVSVSRFDLGNLRVLVSYFVEWTSVWVCLMLSHAQMEVMNLWHRSHVPQCRISGDLWYQCLMTDGVALIPWLRWCLSVSFSWRLVFRN